MLPSRSTSFAGSVHRSTPYPQRSSLLSSKVIAVAAARFLIPKCLFPCHLPHPSLFPSISLLVTYCVCSWLVGRQWNATTKKTCCVREPHEARGWQGPHQLFLQKASNVIYCLSRMLFEAHMSIISPLSSYSRTTGVRASLPKQAGIHIVDCRQTITIIMR
jgi:hypothetical protein